MSYFEVLLTNFALAQILRNRPTAVQVLNPRSTHLDAYWDGYDGYAQFNAVACYLTREFIRISFYLLPVYTLHLQEPGLTSDVLFKHYLNGISMPGLKGEGNVVVVSSETSPPERRSFTITIV